MYRWDPEFDCSPGRGTRQKSGSGYGIYCVSVGNARGGGTLGISGWGCAARTRQPLAYTRASFSWILLPYTRVNTWFP